MAVSPSFRAYIIEQLEGLPHITSKGMFGGVGVYSEEFFFALLDNDRVYFKVNDSNRPDFESVDMGAFEPYGDGRTMQYYEFRSRSSKTRML